MVDRRTETATSTKPGTITNVTGRDENVVQFNFAHEQKRRGTRYRTLLDDSHERPGVYSPDELLRACTYEFLYLDKTEGPTDDVIEYATDILEMAWGRLDTDRRCAAAHGAIAALMLSSSEYDGFSSLRRCLHYGAKDPDATRLGLSVLMHFAEDWRHPILVDRRAVYARYAARSAAQHGKEAELEEIASFVLNTYGQGTR